MQKISFLLIILGLTFGISCKNCPKNNDEKDSVKTENSASVSNSDIQVIYFHATNRCMTCNAVENNARKLLTENFNKEIEDGTISFESINIDLDANKNLTEKYQVSFSTLLIINNKTDEPVVTDFTETAFKFAKNSPDKYAELLKDEISKQLTN